MKIDMPTKIIVHGTWKKEKDFGVYDYKCSVCGQKFSTGSINKYNYCFVCGAEMKGERE